MPYYKTCPNCGAHLDPDEACDCQHETKAPVSAANADEGGVEHVNHAVSAFYDTATEEKKQ